MSGVSNVSAGGIAKSAAKTAAKVAAKENECDWVEKSNSPECQEATARLIKIRQEVATKKAELKCGEKEVEKNEEVQSQCDALDAMVLEAQQKYIDACYCK